MPILDFPKLRAIHTTIPTRRNQYPMHIHRQSHMRSSFFKYQMRVARHCEIHALPFHSQQRADPERRRGST